MLHRDSWLFNNKKKRGKICVYTTNQCGKPNAKVFNVKRLQCDSSINNLFISFPIRFVASYYNLCNYFIHLNPPFKRIRLFRKKINSPEQNILLNCLTRISFARVLHNFLSSAVLNERRKIFPFELFCIKLNYPQISTILVNRSSIESEKTIYIHRHKVFPSNG